MTSIGHTALIAAVLGAIVVFAAKAQPIPLGSAQLGGVTAIGSGNGNGNGNVGNNNGNGNSGNNNGNNNAGSNQGNGNSGNNQGNGTLSGGQGTASLNGMTGGVAPSGTPTGPIRTGHVPGTGVGLQGMHLGLLAGHPHLHHFLPAPGGGIPNYSPPPANAPIILPGTSH